MRHKSSLNPPVQELVWIQKLVASPLHVPLLAGDSPVNPVTIDRHGVVVNASSYTGTSSTTLRGMLQLHDAAAYLGSCMLCEALRLHRARVSFAVTLYRIVFVTRCQIAAMHGAGLEIVNGASHAAGCGHAGSVRLEQ